ncbi:MAG: DUF3857 and transglutaminase domain-containing protein [Bacteroidales bacterium]|nr:DUF3857 and transglutaminase domain-containing protein [Bacteroidales bacterium]
MKRSLVFSVLAFSFILSMQSQNYFEDFGKLNMNELQMTTYNRDNLAEAVVLYDIGKTLFTTGDFGVHFIFDRIVRIKILSKAGLKYAEIEIPYYIDKDGIEKISDIQGITYNLEGNTAKISRLDLKQVYDEKINENWSQKKFALPDVKDGSVIEYRYSIESPFLFNLRDWKFQSTIPVIYSEYTARMIPFYEYTYILQGASKFDVYKNVPGNFKNHYATVDYYDNIYTFGMKNLPAFRDEEFITSINDYITKMDFQLSLIRYPGGSTREIMTTWPLLIQSLLKLNEFGLYMKSIAKSSDELLGTLALESKSNEDKTKAILNYIKSNYNWDGYSSKYANKSTKEFLKTRTGNSANINLFLASMLSAAGIEAYPVLLSTRDHGKIPVDYPFEQFLNYVIVLAKIDNKEILLDATEPLSPFGMLPARCINEKGLIVNKEKTEWIQLVDKGVSEEADSVFITFNETLDSAFADIHVQSLGHKALELRRSYHNDADNLKEYCMKDGIELQGGIAVKNEQSIENPFLFDYKVKTGVEILGDKLLVTVFPGLTPSQNPLKVGFRSYPVDMVYPNSNSFKAIIDIPKGYRFNEGKKNVSVDNALVNIQYQVESTAAQLNITGSYTFKKPVYLPHEYYDLKSYFTTIIETFNNKLMLVKAST